MPTYSNKVEFPFSSFYIALLFISILIVLLAYGETQLSAFLSDIICFVYPAYMSVEAIARRNDPLKDQLLIYWCMFGFFVILDPFQELLVSMMRTYYLVRTLFLVWCYLPIHNNGARFTVHVAPVICSGFMELSHIVRFYSLLGLRKILEKTGHEKKIERYLDSNKFAARITTPSETSAVSKLVRNYSREGSDPNSTEMNGRKKEE